MKILSLFDGMACGAVAFAELGLPIDRYVAYEIDKHAVKVASHNFPFIEQKGDVFEADFAEFNDFDWLIGGSPCTYWSIAQKNNRETEASGLGWELFSQYVRALHEAKPKYFLYENNKSMSKEIKASITETFGFEPVLINSALVSAQNRQRLYWVGIRQEDGTYRKAGVEQPEDRGILLRDVLDSGFDLTSNEKAYCLTKSYNPCAWNTIERSQRNMVAEPVCVTQRGRYAESGKIIQHYEPREDGKTNAITTVQKDNAITEPARIGCYPSPDGKTYPVYEVRNGLITIKDKQYPIKLADGFYIIRKLTVSECMRLQTVPEWYDFSIISNSQAYKCLGNGWTVDVITHIIQGAQIENAPTEVAASGEG